MKNLLIILSLFTSLALHAQVVGGVYSGSTSGGTSHTAPSVSASASPSSITLPTSSFTLTGSHTGGDGTVFTILWTYVSGPTGSFSATNVASPTYSGISTSGTVVLNYKVTDENGMTANVNVSIVVNAATVGGLDTVAIDLAGNGASPYTSNNWNGVSSAAGTVTASNLIRLADGANTGMSISLTNVVAANVNNNNQTGTNGGSGSGTGLCATQQTIFPLPVYTYGWFWVPGSLPTITIGGLSTSNTYDVYILNYRNTSGARNNTVWTCTNNSVTQSVNPQNACDATGIASWTTVTPNGSGQIIIQMTSVNSDGYANAIKVVKH